MICISKECLNDFFRQVCCCYPLKNKNKLSAFWVQSSIYSWAVSSQAKSNPEHLQSQDISWNLQERDLLNGNLSISYLVWKSNICLDIGGIRWSLFKANSHDRINMTKNRTTTNLNIWIRPKIWQQPTLPMPTTQDKHNLCCQRVARLWVSLALGVMLVSLSVIFTI